MWSPVDRKGGEGRATPTGCLTALCPASCAQHSGRLLSPGVSAWMGKWIHMTWRLAYGVCICVILTKLFPLSFIYKITG